MDFIVFFFEMGYIFALTGQGILIMQVYRKKHVEGISFYTQLLFSLAQFIKIFYFPHTMLGEYLVCWLEYFLSSVLCVIMIWSFRKYKRLTMQHEQNYFDYRIIIFVSLVLAVASNWEKQYSFEWAQFFIRFSIILESLGTLPQLKLMR